MAAQGKRGGRIPPLASSMLRVGPAAATETDTPEDIDTVPIAALMNFGGASHRHGRQATTANRKLPASAKPIVMTDSQSVAGPSASNPMAPQPPARRFVGQVITGKRDFGAEGMSAVVLRPTMDELLHDVADANVAGRRIVTWEELVSNRGRHSLSQLPFEVLVVCFEFADFTELCRCCVVCRRWNSIGSSPFLWRRILEGQLKQRRHTQGNGSGDADAHPKAAVRNYVLNLRRHLAENLTVAESHFASVEQRIRDRLESAAPFSTAILDEARENQPRLRDTIRDVEARLVEFNKRTVEYEQLRTHLLTALQDTRVRLAQLEGDVRTYQSRASEFECQVSRRITFEQFERRICRLVLSPVSGLPVVLRRGTTTFASMEMLCLQLGDEDGCGQKVRSRWKAFKSFFPLSDEYFSLSLLSSSADRNPRDLEKLVRRMLGAESDSVLASMIGLPTL